MSDKKPTLVITGATGFIGAAIAKFFADNNWHVIALARVPTNSQRDKKIIKNVLYSKFDLTSTEKISLPDEVDAFIHAGYIKNEKGIDAFKQNVDGATLILKTLENKNCKTKVFISSLSADKNAASVYGKQKSAIEDLFLAQNGSVIRAGLVLGNGGLFGAMRKYLKTNNKIPLFGKGSQPLQTVFVDDLILSIDKIISKELKGTFVVATEEVVAYREFYKALAESLGVKPKFVRAPYWLAAFGIKIATLFGKNLPITKDNLLGLKQMKYIPSANDLNKIGVKLIDYKESFSRLK